MIVKILSYTASSATATLQMEDGGIITVPVIVDFSILVGQSGMYENGVLVMPAAPPVRIVSADPSPVINGTLIYNTAIPALKVGSAGSWVAV